MASESFVIICPRCKSKNRIPRDHWGQRATCGKCHTLSPLFYPLSGEGGGGVYWNYKSEVLDFPGSVLVEFYAPWCGYCRESARVIDKLAREYAGRVKVVQINIDLNGKTASEYGILGTPTLVFFKNGRSMNRVQGALPKEEMERHLRNLL